MFTTLHTNDAPSSIARLLDLGVEPFLITATIEGIVSQRLVRVICENCKAPLQATEDNLLQLGLSREEVADRAFHYGKGCDYCNNTGYKGRTGIFEMMVLDDELRETILQRSSTNVLREKALRKGMRTLRDSGLQAVFDGVTTIDEVVRETVVDTQ